MSREKKMLEITCATCGEVAVLMGSAREGALRPGRYAYCSRYCSDAGRAAGLLAARRARWARRATDYVGQMAALVARDGIARIPLRSQSGAVRGYALVDDEMEPILSAFTWCLGSEGYARRNVRVNGEHTIIRMHRQIKGASDDLEIDHINHNRLDNRRANLRLVTRKKQMQNLSKSKTINGQPPTSRYRGVSWNARKGRWAAQVQVGGVWVFRGLFLVEEEAAVAASNARQRFMTHSVEDLEPAPAVVPTRKPLQKIYDLVAQGDIGRAVQSARPW